MMRFRLSAIFFCFFVLYLFIFWATSPRSQGPTVGPAECGRETAAVTVNDLSYCEKAREAFYLFIF